MMQLIVILIWEKFEYEYDVVIFYQSIAIFSNKHSKRCYFQLIINLGYVTNRIGHWT